MSHKKGDCVKTKRGNGKIERIDHTYSVPLYITHITAGKFKGAKMALLESEIKKTKCR